MMEISSERDHDILTARFRSRALQSIHYELATKRLVVYTAHGKAVLYLDVPPDVVQGLIAHSAPGMLYETYLRRALRPKLSTFSISRLLLLRKIRRAATAPSVREGRMAQLPAPPRPHLG